MRTVSMNTKQFRKYQLGFTIVEIMVAITLSMILIAGVIQVYLSSKESFRVQNELARLQENQRIALEFLQNNIREAGFKLHDAPRIQNRITVTNNANGGTNDEITVSFTSAADCLGDPTPNGIATNRFFVQNQQLMCDGNGNEPGGAQPIADGIESMQILVGENTNFANDTPQVLTADRYVNSAALGSMVNVVSIRIALLTRTLGPIKKQAVNETFTILDTQVNLNGNNADRFKRQVVTTTIPLRNV